MESVLLKNDNLISSRCVGTSDQKSPTTTKKIWFFENLKSVILELKIEYPESFYIKNMLWLHNLKWCEALFFSS